MADSCNAPIDDKIKDLYKQCVTFINNSLINERLPETTDLNKLPDLPTKESEEYEGYKEYIEFKCKRNELIKLFESARKDQKKAAECSVILQTVWKLKSYVKSECTTNVPEGLTYRKHMEVLNAVEKVLSRTSSREPEQTLNTRIDASSQTDPEKVILNSDTTSSELDGFVNISMTDAGEGEERMEIENEEEGTLGRNDHADIQKLSDQVKELSKNLHDCHARCDILQKEEAKLHQQVDSYKKENKGLHELLNQGHRSDVSKDDYKKLSKEKKELKNEFDQLYKAYQTSVKEIQKWQEKTDEYEEYKKINKTITEEYAKLSSEKINFENNYYRYKDAHGKLLNERKIHESQISHLHSQLDSLKKEKDSLMQRLSMVAGMKMKDNNPGIADLSDPNRPEKLSEQFREIYDNSWTDMLDALAKQNDSEEANVQKILETLQMIYTSCQDLVQKRKNRILKSLGYESDILQKEYDGGKDGHDPDIKIVKDLLRKSAKRLFMCASVEIQKSQTIADLMKKSGKDGKEFVKKCTQIVMFMVLQDPPMVLEFSYEQGSKFDKERLAPFTKSGNLIKYLVWPVMYLHQNGPLMNKGVAQGMQTKETNAPKEGKSDQSKGKEKQTRGKEDKQNMGDNDSTGKDKAKAKAGTSNDGNVEHEKNKAAKGNNGDISEDKKLDTAADNDESESKRITVKSKGDNSGKTQNDESIDQPGDKLATQKKKNERKPVTTSTDGKSKKEADPKIRDDKTIESAAGDKEVTGKETAERKPETTHDRTDESQFERQSAKSGESTGGKKKENTPIDKRSEI